MLEKFTWDRIVKNLMKNAKHQIFKATTSQYQLLKVALGE